MPRYRIDLSYNGSAYFGWQKQPNQISVQAEIENALSRINSNKHIEVVGCGRTDTGVHARHYVLHTEMEQVPNTKEFAYKLNRMLPSSIAFLEIREVSNEFHARFGAKKRTYRYFIHQQKDPFLNDQSWHFSTPLNLKAMNDAAHLLIGKKDFTSFSKLHTDVKTNICEVTQAKWYESENHQIYFEISADRFLRNMVRAVVGTLVDVGLGKLQPEEILKILDKKDRGEASISVPPQGLFLWKIEY